MALSERYAAAREKVHERFMDLIDQYEELDKGSRYAREPGLEWEAFCGGLGGFYDEVSDLIDLRGEEEKLAESRKS